jgi:hypothetical protein
LEDPANAHFERIFASGAPIAGVVLEDFSNYLA